MQYSRHSISLRWAITTRRTMGNDQYTSPKLRPTIFGQCAIWLPTNLSLFTSGYVLSSTSHHKYKYVMLYSQDSSGRPTDGVFHCTVTFQLPKLHFSASYRLPHWPSACIKLLSLDFRSQIFTWWQSVWPCTCALRFLAEYYSFQYQHYSPHSWRSWTTHCWCAVTSF
jgi:hypothetical protein